jgi:hypothetical protein
LDNPDKTKKFKTTKEDPPTNKKQTKEKKQENLSERSEPSSISE